MDTAIIAALIGGFATVVAAIVGVLRLKGKKSDKTSTDNRLSQKVHSKTAPSVAISGDANIVNIESTAAAKQSDIRLVDIAIDESTDEFPKLDIKIRNTGDEPAFLKKACFEVTHVFVPIEFREISYQMQPVTWEYDVHFTEETGSIESAISQIVQPKGSDRFVFKLGQECGPPGLAIIVRFRVRIVYDEDDKLVDSDYFICTIPRAVEIVGSYIATTDEEKLRWNIEQIVNFSKLTGTQSKGAQRQFEHIRDVKDS
jgi:hypothetical protein